MEDKKKRQARQKRYDDKRRGKSVTIRLDCEADQALTKAIRTLLSTIEKYRNKHVPRAIQIEKWSKNIYPIADLIGIMLTLEKHRPDSPPQLTVPLMLNIWTQRIKQIALIQYKAEHSVIDQIDDWIEKELATKRANKQE